VGKTRSAAVYVASAVAVAGWAAFGAHGHAADAVHARLAAIIPAATTPAPTPVPVPAANSYTPATWAVALLADDGEPDTRCNVAFLVAWEHAEGGHWGNAAKHNPLDDELPEPGSHPINDTGGGRGVQAYTSWAEGLAATVFTLQHYPAIRAALAAGGNAQAAADAVADSSWGTERFAASC
jgi:hypothetical protein